jgi:hypothetical protein
VRIAPVANEAFGRSIEDVGPSDEAVGPSNELVGRSEEVLGRPGRSPDGPSRSSDGPTRSSDDPKSSRNAPRGPRTVRRVCRKIREIVGRPEEPVGRSVDLDPTLDGAAGSRNSSFFRHLASTLAPHTSIPDPLSPDGPRVLRARPRERPLGSRGTILPHQALFHLSLPHDIFDGSREFVYTWGHG